MNKNVKMIDGKLVISCPIGCMECRNVLIKDNNDAIFNALKNERAEKIIDIGGDRCDECDHSFLDKFLYHEHKNEKIIKKVLYINGKKHGECVRFYYPKLSDISYGEHVRYDKISTFYNNGLKHGKVIYYKQNFRFKYVPMLTETYNNGKKDVRIKTFNENVYSLVDMNNFKEKKNRVIVYFKGCSPEVKEELLDGTRKDEDENLDLTGVKAICYSENDKLKDYFISFYKNGNIQKYCYFGNNWCRSLIEELSRISEKDYEIPNYRTDDFICLDDKTVNLNDIHLYDLVGCDKLRGKNLLYLEFYENKVAKSMFILKGGEFDTYTQVQLFPDGSPHIIFTPSPSKSSKIIDYKNFSKII